jgi:hypothetical protein
MTPQPIIMDPHELPVSQMTSRVKSARGTIIALPARRALQSFPVLLSEEKEASVHV